MALNRDRRIRLAFILTAGILAIELAAGVWAHSLALLSDAGHVITDLLVLALSAFAMRQAVRPATPRKTFGYQRGGILVALINALLLGAIVLGIVIEAVRRLQHPATGQGGLMSIAALVALAISPYIAWSLRLLAAGPPLRSVLGPVWGGARATAAGGGRGVGG